MPINSLIEFVSLERLGDAPVFDLTESDTHHFIANGLRVHNCSEYVFIDDTACNLASLNLVRFLNDDGNFDAKQICGCEPHLDDDARDFGRYGSNAVEAYR